MDISKDELKEIALSSYELLVKLPAPKAPESERDKYEITSRSKLKTLPEALRENEDSAASITHFVKHLSYSLPRAESGDGKGMLSFMYLLLEKIKAYHDKDDTADKKVSKIKYLVGYTNWNIDAVCSIFTAHRDDNEQVKKRLEVMLSAELGVVGAGDNVDKIVSNIMGWKKKSDEKQQPRPQYKQPQKFQRGRY
ncbi:MAG: hypothetical protein IBX39_06675 [Candidatus Methanoperedenaceae archaeon]|nr:hypothetical protein [Candidatus Methanoperedenaceae archaeon]